MGSLGATSEKLMQPEKVKRMELLALRSELNLQDFCKRFEATLGLPKMEFDRENETEWGEIEFNGINYNVSRSYKERTLQEWDDSVPNGCNFGICLQIPKGHEQENNLNWIQDNLVIPVANLLTKEFDTIVYYHRTWLGPGKNETRTAMFKSN